MKPNSRLCFDQTQKRPRGVTLIDLNKKAGVSGFLFTRTGRTCNLVLVGERCNHIGECDLKQVIMFSYGEAK